MVSMAATDFACICCIQRLVPACTTPAVLMHAKACHIHSPQASSVEEKKMRKIRAASEVQPLMWGAFLVPDMSVPQLSKLTPDLGIPVCAPYNGKWKPVQLDEKLLQPCKLSYQYQYKDQTVTNLHWGGLPRQSKQSRCLLIGVAAVEARLQ